MEIKHDILWRVYLSFVGVVVLSLAVLGKAAYIQGVDGDHWRSMSDSLHQKFVPIEAERGTIYSEDGQMLSTSIPYFDIYMDFGADGLRDKKGRRFRENVDSFSIALSHYFNDKTSSAWKKELETAYRQERRYYLIRKGLNFEEWKAFRDFPLVRLGRNKSGIIPETHSKRLNPYGMLARRTIGLDRDNAQNVGLERTYDSLLKGTRGKRLVRYIAGGAAIPVEGYEIEAENGHDVITTLNTQMQDIVTSALMKMMVGSQSQYGTCILMETKTGKIRAMANLGRDAKGNYGELMNYALMSTEPGSTIKLATLLAVLDHRKSININNLVEVGSAGSAYVGVRNVNDAERAPKPLLTIRECFAHSSNVGMGKLAYEAFASEPDIYKNYLHKFHMDSRTGIDLVGEGRPVMPRLKRNKEGLHAMITASFGYALQVTPLQTLTLYNAIANNGKMMKPYLVNSIKRNGITIENYEPQVMEEELVSENIIKAAQECMEAVVTEGTAKDIFKDFPFAVAGKTGTAHVAGGNIHYGDGVYQASFAGYFPAKDPEFSCIVVIRTAPHAVVHFGGQLAAPVFKEIATKLFAQHLEGGRKMPLKVVPDSSNYTWAGSTADVRTVFNQLSVKYKDSASQQDWSGIYQNEFKPVVNARPQQKHIMPDLMHMTIKDALYLADELDLRVVMSGKGKVAAQSIAPGTPIAPRQTVNLLLHP